MPFESYLVRPDDRTTRRRRRGTLVVAGLVHAALLGAAFVHAVWFVDELTLPVVSIPTFWAPPPPMEPVAGDGNGGRRPPATKERAATTPVTRRELVQPVRVEPETKPSVTDESLETDPPAGPASGPAGGDGPPGGGGGDGPPGSGGGGGPPGLAPRILPPTIAAKACASCPQPHLPPAYVRAGGQHALVARVCADRDGRVTSVRILRGIGPGADEAVTATVAGWRYTPATIDGRPTPFCTIIRFVFTTE